MKLTVILLSLLVVVVPRYVTSSEFRSPPQFTGNGQPPPLSPVFLPFSLQECKEPETAHAQVFCEYSGCRVLCDKNYKLPSGLGFINLDCDRSSGQLTLNGSPWHSDDGSCTPYCGIDGCQNGGQCIQPNICQCMPGYTGKNCQVPPENTPNLATNTPNPAPNTSNLPQDTPNLAENTPNTCLEPDFPILNAEFIREGEQLVVRCNAGYVFKIGGTFAVIQCRNGIWDHPRGIFASNALMCIESQCHPPCQNGGVCLDNEVCDCPYKYWGAVCQMKRCDIPDAASLSNASLGGVHSRMKIQCHRRHIMITNKRTQTILCRDGEWKLPGRGFLTDNDVKCYRKNEVPVTRH